MTYFDMMDNGRDKMDYYFGQLTGIMSQKKRYRIKDFMMPLPWDDGGRAVMSAKDAAKILKRQSKATKNGKTKRISDGENG